MAFCTKRNPQRSIRFQNYEKFHLFSTSINEIVEQVGKNRNRNKYISKMKNKIDTKNTENLGTANENSKAVTHCPIACGKNSLQTTYIPFFLLLLVSLQHTKALSE